MFWEVLALMFVAVILILLLYLYIRQRIHKETCNVKVHGFIKSINIHESPTMGEAEMPGTSIGYTVTIGYEYNGQNYEYLHYAIKREFGKLIVGTPINIRIDPNDPNKVYCSETLESELYVL